jgi:hypothetical protein
MFYVLINKLKIIIFLWLTIINLATVYLNKNMCLNKIHKLKY